MKKYRDIYAFLFYFILGIVYFGKVLFGKGMLFGTDWLLGAYANQSWMAQFVKTYHEFAYWNPYIFCGYPTVASFFGEMFTPVLFMRLFLPTHITFAWLFASMTFVGSFGMYLFLKEIGIRPIYRILGGLVYGWSGFFLSTVYAGHHSRMVSAELFPLIMYLILAGMNRKSIRYFILAGGTGGLALLMGHFQMTYYMVPTALAFVIYIFVINRKDYKREELKRIGIGLGLTLLIGFLMYSFYIFPVLKNMPYASRGATRGYEFATSWSMPPEETLNLITPHFSGILDNYWGRNYFKLHTEFAGILVLLLFFGGAILEYRRRWVKFFLWVLGVTLIFAWGGHTFFFRIFYYLLPGIKKFRAPNMIFYQCVFSMVVIGFIFLEHIKWDKRLRNYLIGFTGFLLLMAIIFSIGRSGFISSFSSFISSKLARTYSQQLIMQKISALRQNYSHLIKGLWLSLLFGLLYAGIIIGILQRRLKGWMGVSIMGILFLLEMWPVERRFVKIVPTPDVYFAPDEVVNFIKLDTGKFRVFPLRYQHDKDGLLMINGIENIGGYGGNPPKLYQKYIGAEKTVLFQPMALIRNPHLIDLLNVKYLIDVPLPEDFSKYPQNVRQQLVYWQNFLSRFEMVYQGKNYVIYNNPYACERVYLVSNYHILDSHERILNAIKNPDYSYKDSVFLVDKPEFEPANRRPDYQIDIEEYSPNRILLNLKTDIPGILVFSENYHPEWKAYVDGKNVKVHRVNFLFRGVVVPAGEHRVSMVYSAKPEHLGLYLSILGYLLFIVGFFLPRGGKVSDKDKDKD